MAEAVKPDVEIGSVQAGLNYLVRTAKKPVSYVNQPGVGTMERTARYKKHTVAIHDGRRVSDRLALDREGFALARHASKVIDFYDAQEVGGVYNPEVEQLLKDVTGASRVLVFDHTLRAEAEATRQEKQVREPVRIAHNDYTDRSGPQRVRDLLPDEAGDLLQRRFAFVNVWRPIRGPVKSAPLAVCDAQSIGPDDLVATDLKYDGRTGEVQQLAFSPNHRWFYFPDMQTDEVVLIKCYDSVTDGRARFAAHTAFDDPTSPADAAPRESIETRTIAFFDSPGR